MKESIKSTTTKHEEYTIGIEWHQDPDMGPPWKEHDGHGEVSLWTTRAKRPGERTLVRDRCFRRYYDVMASISIAKRDGWGLSPAALTELETRLGRSPTSGEIIADAVANDFHVLRDWCNDVWQWVGYSLEIINPDGKLIFEESLWGMESPSMAEFEAEIMRDAKAYIHKELMESHACACRDIATV